MAIKVERVNRLARRVKFRDMNVFHAVAHAGSMARAASDLAVAQPVVSKTIKALEESLGVRLFDRSTKGIELTDYGEVLLAKTRVVFAEIDEAIKGIEFLKDPTVGEVRIASPESMNIGLLPMIIDRFMTAHPGATLQVLQANTFPLDFRPLRERKVDMMLGRIAPKLEERELEAEVLFHEELVAVVGRQHPLARKRSVRLSDLLDEKWILAPVDTAAGSLWAEAFDSTGLPLPKISISTFSMNLRNSLISAGRFVTMMPRSVWKFTAAQSSAVVLPMKLNLQRAPVAIVTIKGRSLSPMADRFANAIRLECKAQGLA
jgi:DNA-binding transcriptional LysR family regulator